ncbi:MAG: hypothetical protein NTY35_07435 [Planctomycetota bacterium]|nr:hypothetical protein [Planctomycetota bacterium]
MNRALVQILASGLALAVGGCAHLQPPTVLRGPGRFSVRFAPSPLTQDHRLVAEVVNPSGIRSRAPVEVPRGSTAESMRAIFETWAGGEWPGLRVEAGRVESSVTFATSIAEVSIPAGFAFESLVVERRTETGWSPEHVEIEFVGSLGSPNGPRLAGTGP